MDHLAVASRHCKLPLTFTTHSTFAEALANTFCEQQLHVVIDPIKTGLETMRPALLFGAVQYLSNRTSHKI